MISPLKFLFPGISFTSAAAKFSSLDPAGGVVKVEIKSERCASLDGIRCVVIVLAVSWRVTRQLSSTHVNRKIYLSGDPSVPFTTICLGPLLGGCSIQPACLRSCLLLSRRQILSSP